MAIYMTGDVTPYISALPSYDRIAELRVGSNGDSLGIPGYDVGSSSTDLSTGETVWDNSTGNGFSSGPVAIALDANLASGNDSFEVDGSPSVLDFSGDGGGTISSVQLRADAQIPGTVQWSGVTIQFYKEGVLQDSVSLYQGPEVDTTSNSSTGTAEQVETVQPSSSDDDEVEVIGTYEMASPPGTNPGANDLFGQIVIMRNPDSDDIWTNNSLNINGSVCLATDADQQNVDVWQDATAPGEGTLVQQIPLDEVAEMPGLVASGSTGNNSLVLDFANGDPLPPSGLSFEGGSGVNTVAVIGTSSNDTITANSGGLTFSNSALGSIPINFANIQALQLTAGSGIETFNITGGAFTVDADTPAGTPNVTVNVTGSGTAVVFPTTQYLAELSIGAGSTAQMSAGTTADSQTLNLASLNISSTGQLDLTNNTMYINYATGTDPASQIQAYLASGYNSGNWNGYGIISSDADSSTYALGWADGNSVTVGGLSAGSIEVMYTLYGDANLDGVVNFTDFQIQQNNYNQAGVWSQGDFNYSGVANFTDYQFLQNNYGDSV